MIYELLWLPVALKDAGLKVAVIDGWESRGRARMGEVAGVICHHTAGPREGNMPSLRLLVEGRPALQGPLAQLGLGRDGTYYVVAAGRCNHAGGGSWMGITTGNTSFIGIEAENAGDEHDPWPEVQMDAYWRGVAAILKHIGRGTEACAGHKEYALPHGRKTDPSFDMNDFRRAVGGVMGGTLQTRPPIPPVEPATNGATPRPTLRRGATGDLIKTVQTRLGLTPDGFFGPETEAALRQFQKAHELVPDGIVGPKTWVALDKN